MKTNHIARFEQAVQRLVEGTFARLFAGRLQPLEVANALARAMEDYATPGPGGFPQAPSHYEVALNPADLDALLEQRPDLANVMAKQLIELAQQAGYILSAPPVVNLTSQTDIALREVRVDARWLAPGDALPIDDATSTLQMPLAVDRGDGAEQALASQPFLILEGQRHIVLVGSTISLGRSFDNNIVVDDARVSRYHAQLRQRYDRYVIYDVGSKGGTTVNGYAVQECVLEPGDVISLAGVEIIYGEDSPAETPPRRGTSNTPPLRRSELPETGRLPHLPTDPTET